jgi:hypothetical protein
MERKRNVRTFNEPCSGRSANACRELAHERAFDELCAYGECRDSEQLKAATLSAGLITDNHSKVN